MIIRWSLIAFIAAAVLLVINYVQGNASLNDNVASIVLFAGAFFLHAKEEIRVDLAMLAKMVQEMYIQNMMMGGGIQQAEWSHGNDKEEKDEEGL